MNRLGLYILTIAILLICGTTAFAILNPRFIPSILLGPNVIKTAVAISKLDPWLVVFAIAVPVLAISGLTVFMYQRTKDA